MEDVSIISMIAAYAAIYQPLISVGEAAAIAKVTPKTIYDWSSRGLLDPFKSKRGRHLRLIRDQFVRFVTEDSPQTTL